MDKHHPCAGAIYFTDSLIPGVGYIDKTSGIHHNSTREVQLGGGTLSTISSKTVDAVPCDGKDDPGGGIYSTNPLTENIRNKKITG